MIKQSIKRTYWLYLRETKRVFVVVNQTIIGPVATAFMFSYVLYKTSAQDSIMFDAQKYHLIVVGMLISTIITSAFTNTSSSIVGSKMMGFINDILIPPLSKYNITIAYIMSSMTRSISIATLLYIITNIFIPIKIFSFLHLTFHFISAVIMMSLVGMITGVGCNSVEKISSVGNYIITPLSLFSGNFFVFSGKMAIVNKLNPLFYVVNGLKYGFGYESNVNILTGYFIICIVNTILLMTIFWILTNGWKIKN